jgi:hypothetical protein
MDNLIYVMHHQFEASNVIGLLKLADRYQCQLLRDRCERHLVNCVELRLLELLHCADLYGLNKFKVVFQLRTGTFWPFRTQNTCNFFNSQKNLLMSIEGTDLSKLVQQSKPYFGMLSLIIKMEYGLMKESA